MSLAPLRRQAKPVGILYPYQGAGDNGKDPIKAKSGCIFCQLTNIPLGRKHNNAVIGLKIYQTVHQLTQQKPMAGETKRNVRGNDDIMMFSCKKWLPAEDNTCPRQALRELQPYLRDNAQNDHEKRQYQSSFLLLSHFSS